MIKLLAVISLGLIIFINAYVFAICILASLIKEGNEEDD